jgi:hypothetical protein
MSEVGGRTDVEVNEAARLFMADFVAEVGDCNGEATPPIFWNGLSQPPCLRGWALPGG